jgi:3-methyladenine DNA glycosylase AlkD
MSVMLDQIKADLRKIANTEKAAFLSGFFKTGKGQYAEGDFFLGITVPAQRLIAKKYQELSLKELPKLLSSKIHEERLLSLLILIIKYKKAARDKKKLFFDFYLQHLKCVNNWDLVDLSAEKILGDYLFDKDRSILYSLAGSDNLWKKRIAIMSTFAFIKRHDFDDTIHIANMLLNEKHDLIQKATGWMLREIGKRNLETEEEFLKKHYKKMPRTMLRYAIERFEKQKRMFYLGK